MPDAIHLVYGSDDSYWFYTAVSAASAAHGCSAPLTLHLFDLGIDDEHYAEYERLVRRAAFVFLKHNQWILSLHPYLRGHLGNTGGLADARWRAISRRT